MLFDEDASSKGLYTILEGENTITVGTSWVEYHKITQDDFFE